jgi:hypothetical protein
MQDLKGEAIRGRLARLCAQAATLLLRVDSLVVLGLTWFPDFGLSAGAVQRKTVTEEQISTLFWVDILLGALLGLVAAASAPAIPIFYGEPRLFAVAHGFGTRVSFQCGSVQHSALLQCNALYGLRCDQRSLFGRGTVIAIAGAEAGYGYWALVAMSVATPLAGVWLVTGWVPRMPRRRTMIHFGFALTGARLCCL